MASPQAILALRRRHLRSADEKRARLAARPFSRERTLRYAGFVDGAAPALGVAPPDEFDAGAGAGFGGRGGLPDMMSSICSASIVSNSSSAFAIASTLSRLSSRILRATAYGRR